MGHGEQTSVRDDDKKGGRPFGGADGGRDEDKGEFSAKEVAGYFAKHGWPLVIGLFAFVALCYWLYTSLSPGMNLPTLVPVSGTVTLDGKPLANAMIRFQPIEEPGAKLNLFLSTPVGQTDANGKARSRSICVREREEDLRRSRCQQAFRQVINAAPINRESNCYPSRLYSTHTRKSDIEGRGRQGNAPAGFLLDSCG